MKVAFIGLGTMGAPMARCLVQAGHDVAGWDVIEAARANVDFCARDLDDAVHLADAIITMLPASQDVEAVHTADALAGLPAGRLLIDCSTIDVETTQRLAELAESRGHSMLDAPVSGGAEGAGRGALSFMVGGRAEGFAKAEPLLQAMGTKITHFGESGTGQAAKACHNMICGITALGVSEAFALADALGLDADKFFELCKGAAAQSWILENRCPVPGPAPDAPSANGYAPGFAARLMAKDLGLAQAAARAAGQDTPFGAEAARRFAAFAKGADGDLDFSAIYRTIRKG
ncbi:MAG: 3-hydroxyisobutyrate dehydrogenase [Pseudomonadota bacterium]